MTGEFQETLKKRDWLFVLLNKNTSLAGWWLMLQTPKELFDYLVQTNSKYGQAVVVENDSQTPGKIAALAELKAANRHQSVIQAICNIAAEKAQNILDSILTRGYVYINQNGGYCWSGDRESNDFTRRSALVWPDFTEQDIQISQFPGGMHYYAYIGNVQVSKHGVRHFWTESQARNAAKAYILGNED